MVVDDSESLLATSAAILSREGYVVETARDGFEALAFLRGSVPEILVSDLKMPMSGFELLAVVRKRFPHIGVIAIGGEFLPSRRPEGVLADRYIAKGENCAFELVEAVRELLSYHPVRGQPSKPELAPAWLPRSKSGYVVVTCPDCLRSTSILRSQAEPGVILKDTCIQCGVSVSYRIDATTVPESRSVFDVSRERAAAMRKRIADSSKKIATSEHPRSDKSGRKRSR